MKIAVMAGWNAKNIKCTFIPQYILLIAFKSRSYFVDKFGVN